MENSHHGVPKSQSSDVTSNGSGPVHPQVGPPLTPSRNGGPGSRKNGSNTPGAVKKLRPNGLSDFTVGTRLEAKDFKDMWYPAKITEVDWEEEEIFIHFEKWSIRYDEWIPMDSSRIRPITKEAEVKGTSTSRKIFSVGDNVMATWTNNCKYPAKVVKTLANDNYEVRFYDGFHKAVRGTKMSKMKDTDVQLVKRQTELERPPDSKGHQDPPKCKQQEPVPAKPQSNCRFPNALSSQSQQASLIADPPSGSVALVPGTTPPGLPGAAAQPYPPPMAAYQAPTPLMIAQPTADNIGTKEQRKDRKRKLNVAELFTKKRSRLEDKSASPSPTRARHGPGERKTPLPHSPLMGGAGLMGGSVVKLEPGSLTNTSAQNAGPILGTDPMFPADPLKVEGGMLSPVDEVGMAVPKIADRKKRRRFKKRKEGAVGGDGIVRKGGKMSDPEYSVRWEDGEPQGEAAYVIDGAEGPRKSIIVDDRRLPEGWSKHAIRRQGGTSAGKWDVFLVSPRDGRKFRSRTELRSYHSERGLKFQVERFDFSLGRKKSYRHKVTPSAKPSAEVDQGNGCASGSGAENGDKGGMADLGTPSTTSGQAPGAIPPPHSASGHAQAAYGQPPVQRVKTLLPKVRLPAAGSPSRKVMSPPPPHSTTPQLLTPHPAVVEQSPSLQLSAASDGDGFKCPKEGCEKRFRKENLLQMHIKHYHPEYNRFMGSTPNVADLAYARTIGEPLSEVPSRNRANGPSFIEKISRFEANRKAAGASPSPGGPVIPAAASGEGVNGAPPEPMSSLEARSPTLNLLLKRGPMRKENGDGTIAAANAAAAWMVKNIGDPLPLPLPLPPSPLASDGSRTPGPALGPGQGLSESSSPCDSSKFDDAHLRLGGRPSSRPSTRPTSPDHPRDESDVSRDLQSPMLADQSFPAPSPLSASTSPSYFFKKKHHPEKNNADGFRREERKSTSPIDQLRREELINCTCGYTEEDGLMIQCDLCLCWQHGTCNKIEHEDEVPEKYVCQICLHPMRERRSRRFLHDQSWLKDGILPSFAFIKKNPGDRKQREDLLQRSHDLCGTLLQMQKVIHSLRIKVEIAEQKDHPKLYLWANSWVKEPPPSCPTPPASPVSPTTKSPILAQQLADGTTVKLEPKLEPDSELDKGKSLLQEALLNGSPVQPPHQHLSSGLDLPLSENLFEQIANAVEDKLRAPEMPIVPPVPQPEAPIDPFECRLKLLDHIEHFQTQLDARLNSMEEQVAALESEDPDVTSNEAADFFPQTKQTVQMLLRDLTTVRTFAALS